MSIGFDYHTGYRPCPVGGGNKHCRTSKKTGHVHCHCTPSYANVVGFRYWKDDSQGFAIFRPDDAHGDRHPETSVPANPRPAPKVIEVHPNHPRRPDGEPYTPGNMNFREVDRIATAMTPEQAAELARIFDGTPSALPDWRFVERDRGYASNGSHLGWESGYAVYEYGNLHRTGSGVVEVGPVAIHFRITGSLVPTWMAESMAARGEDTSKHTKRSYGSPNAEGAARGHILPRFGGHPRAHAFKHRKELIAVEGASDAFALDAFGIDTVGRPNNRAGADTFAEIAPHVIDDLPDRKLIVLGENDRKADGNWPGRTGAMLYGRDATELLQPANGTRVGMVPPEFKDAREYIHSLWDGKDTIESRTRAADAFLRGIAEHGLGHVMRPGRLTPPEEAAGHRIPTFGRQRTQAEVIADEIGRVSPTCGADRADSPTFRIGDVAVPDLPPLPEAVQRCYIEAREQREREEVIARDAVRHLAEMRASNDAPFYCPDLRPIPNSIDTDNDAKVSGVARCQKWTCCGCRNWLREREIVRLTVRLAGLSEVFIALCPYGEWNAGRKRIDRAEADYHKIDIGDELAGMYHLTMTQEVPGFDCIKETPQGAIAIVRAHLEAYTGSVNPCSASDVWKYPEPEKTNRKRIGGPSVPLGADRDMVSEVAAMFDHTAEYKGGSFRDGGAVVRSWTFRPNNPMMYRTPEGKDRLFSDARRMFTIISNRHYGLPDESDPGQTAMRFGNRPSPDEDVCNQLDRWTEQSLHTGPRHLIC